MTPCRVVPAYALWRPVLDTVCDSLKVKIEFIWPLNETMTLASWQGSRCGKYRFNKTIVQLSLFIKWFARRPGTLFRGFLLSEFGKAPLMDIFFEADDLRAAVLPIRSWAAGYLLSRQIG